MKAYDCALVRMEQSLKALLKVTHPLCGHSQVVQFPTDEVILMNFSEPHSMLINMPVMRFCAQCGLLLSTTWPSPREDADRNVGYYCNLI